MALVESYTKSKIDELLAAAKTTADGDYADITEPLAVTAQAAADAAQADADAAQSTGSAAQTTANTALAAVVPSGGIVAYGGAAAPTGWLLCDGSSLLRSSYAALFAAIGTTYGSVDGTHFTLPDLRGRVPLGVDGAAGRITANDALGNSSGTEAHTHTSAAHTHGHSATHTHGVSATHTHTSAAHSHNLSANGQALIVFSTSAASVWMRTVTNSWTAMRKAATGGVGAANSDSLTTGAELAGSTDSATPGATGASSPGSTDANNPGTTDSTTPGSTGSTSNLPPYQVVNYIIKT